MIPLRDINPTESRPVVTYGLVAINVVVFLAQVFAPADLAELWVHRYGMVPYYLTQERHLGSLTTLLSSMFMHGGWLHLLSNMWFLYIFGDNVEESLGRVRFLVFYLACGVFAALAQVAIDPSSQVPMVGASGAIAGVLAAYFRMFPRARVVTLLPIFIFFIVRELPAVFFIVVWFLLQLLSGVGSLRVLGQGGGGIAFFAHIGGFLAGLVLLSWMGRKKNGRQGFRVQRAPEPLDQDGYGP